jgi:hypothetical protein
MNTLFDNFKTACHPDNLPSESESVLKIKVIQGLTVHAYGTPGNMLFKVFGKTDTIYFQSTKPMYDTGQCFRKAEQVCIRFWEQDKEND